jgi:hypothetical protein
MATSGLTKARLVRLTGKSTSTAKQMGDAEQPAQDGFTVLFNPQSLKLTYSNTLEAGNARNKQQRQYIGKQSSDLAVELTFDTTEIPPTGDIPFGDDLSKQRADQARQIGDVDVRIFTAAIIAMMDKAEKSDKPAPYRVQFVWGAFLFEGVLKSATETIDLFSSDGVPLRATLSITISEDALEFRRATPASNTPLTVPTAGSTAASTAAAAGRPADSGKAMAALNNLDDVRSLPGDVALELPTFGAAGGASASIGASVGGGIGFGASASAGFGVSADVSASASASGDFSISGGFGGGAGLDVSLGGGGGFGLDGGASAGGSFGLGVSGGISAGFGVSGGISAGVGIDIGAGAGLNLAVSGGVSGGVAGGASFSVSLAGAGAIGGPTSGSPPGAQSVMSPDGRLALAPATPPPPLRPPSATSANDVSTTRTAPTPPRPVPDERAAPVSSLQTPALVAGGTRVSGAIALNAAPATTTMGLPPPLPPDAARPAFRGISGVPLKAVRFGASTPPPTPLAYRRLPPDDTCLEPPGICDPTETAPATSGSTHRKRGGCGCGCCH